MNIHVACASCVYHASRGYRGCSMSNEEYFRGATCRRRHPDMPFGPSTLALMAGASAANDLATGLTAVVDAAQLEAARTEAERLEAERLEAERLEAERLEANRVEAERLEAERLEAEQWVCQIPRVSALEIYSEEARKDYRATHPRRTYEPHPRRTYE